MTDKGLYSRAQSILLEKLPLIKGETLSREQLYRICNININNPDHIPFRDALNQVLYQWTVTNKVKDKIVKNGSGFKIVDDELIPIDFLSSQGTEFDLDLPFGIHNYCFLYKKNIMIVYGSRRKALLSKTVKRRAVK